MQKGVVLFKGHKDRVRSVAVSALQREPIWFLYIYPVISRPFSAHPSEDSHQAAESIFHITQSYQGPTLNFSRV